MTGKRGQNPATAASSSQGVATEFLVGPVGFFCVAQPGLKLTAALLPWIPEYWTYRYTSLCWAVFLALYRHLATESHPLVSVSPYPVFILIPHQHTFAKYSSLSAPFAGRPTILSAHPGQIHLPLILCVWSGTLHWMRA